MNILTEADLPHMIIASWIALIYIGSMWQMLHESPELKYGEEL